MVRPIGVEPITFWSVVKRSIQLSYERTCLLRIRLLAHKIIFSRWWLQLESNQRHQDFQSCALPTELWSHMAVPTGLEPAIPRVTGECDNHYTTEPFGCGSWIWTNDLRVMSPKSYQTAPSRDIVFFLLFLSFIYILYNTLEEKCKYFWLFYVEKLYFGYCQAHFLFFFSPFLIYNIIINPKARKMQVF